MARTELALYRSVRKEKFPDGTIVDDHAVEGVLYPSFKDEQIWKGGELLIRQADLYPYKHEGVDVIDSGGGASLFNKPDIFGKKWWWCFEIPEGTVIPPSLRIVYTGHNKKYDADHYEIQAAGRRMPVTAYKGALDNLARNAVVNLYEKARARDAAASRR